MKTPSVFISYSHDDKPLAQELAAALEAQGVDVWIDERELRVGDSIIERVATAVAETDFFIALVSESSRDSQWCQKELHLAISGELKREGVVVLPLRVGDVEMPATLADVLYLSVDPGDIGPTVGRLVRDVRRHAAADTSQEPESASSEGQTASTSPDPPSPSTIPETATEPLTYEPIRITGIVKEGIGEPANDGAKGSALYRVPLRLSRNPPSHWTQIFEHEWNTQLYSMLREAYVEGDTIVFPATTMDEMERHHVRQLRQVVERVNTQVEKLEREARIRAQREAAERAERRRAHDESIERIAGRLKFD